MPLPFAAIPPIATAVGRYGVPYLVREVLKVGKDKFVNTYGNEAFTSINNLSIQSSELFQKEVENYTNDIDEGKEEETTGTELSTEIKKEEPPKLPEEPPKGPDIGTELATEAVTQATKKILEDKKPDVSKQTKDLIPEKPEFGKLTKTETQTAKALKSDSPDFYSRAVDAIKNAKQNKFTKGKWKSIVQSNSTKEEMKYLGLDKYLQGNKSITKEELLKFVDDKNIAPYINVTTGTYEDIAPEGMADTYKNYTLGFGKDEEFTSFQVDKSFYNNENMFQSQHGNDQYGNNMFAHARTQVGVGDPDSPPADFGSNGKQIAEKLKNTLIVDEIQSDWLQKANKSGFESEWTIIKGDKITEEFLKNYESEYEIESNKSDMPSNLVATLYTPDTEGDLLKIQTIVKDQYYVFDKEGIHLGQNFQADTLEQAQREVIKESAPDFPLVQSKKWVELVLNKMIEKAVLDGRDSIAITNGQIQFNRYDGMDRENAEGLKKFYNEIVTPQLEKISKEYNVNLEKISIDNPEENVFDNDLMAINTRMKESMDAGYTLKKINGQLLEMTMADAQNVNENSIPDFFSIYGRESKGQGMFNIINVLDQENPRGSYIDDSTNPNIPQVKAPNDYYLWVLKDSKLENAIDNHNTGKEDYASLIDFFLDKEERPTAFGSTTRTSVKFDMPMSLVEDDIEPEATIPAGTGPDDLADAETVRVSTGDIPDNTNYSAFLMNQYIKNRDKALQYKDLEYEEDASLIIKMQLPKKLQKERLSKPIKLSRVKKQTDRLLA